MFEPNYKPKVVKKKIPKLNNKIFFYKYMEMENRTFDLEVKIDRRNCILKSYDSNYQRIFNFRPQNFIHFLIGSF